MLQSEFELEEQAILFPSVPSGSLIGKQQLSRRLVWLSLSWSDLYTTRGTDLEVTLRLNEKRREGCSGGRKEKRGKQIVIGNKSCFPCWQWTPLYIQCTYIHAATHLPITGFQKTIDPTIWIILLAKWQNKWKMGNSLGFLYTHTNCFNWWFPLFRCLWLFILELLFFK
jgi:hypothetical protein